MWWREGWIGSQELRKSQLTRGRHGDKSFRSEQLVERPWGKAVLGQSECGLVNEHHAGVREPWEGISSD